MPQWIDPLGTHYYRGLFWQNVWSLSNDITLHLVRESPSIARTLSVKQ